MRSPCADHLSFLETIKSLFCKDFKRSIDVVSVGMIAIESEHLIQCLYFIILRKVHFQSYGKSHTGCKTYLCPERDQIGHSQPLQTIFFLRYFSRHSGKQDSQIDGTLV